jgi:hypothetical protein
MHFKVLITSLNIRFLMKFAALSLHPKRERTKSVCSVNDTRPLNVQKTVPIWFRKFM